MSKLEVLLLFARHGGFLKPDAVLGRLQPVPDRCSLYSYLGRLREQGLLERHPNARRGYLAYRLTGRGQTRLEYFRRSGRS
jgi:hypothetical protein